MPLHFRSLVLVLVLVVVVSLSLFGSIVAIATAAVASSAILPTRSTSISMSSTASTESTPTGVAARLARPNILELQPYRCARDDYSTGILLDANENAYGSPLQKNHPNHRKNPQQNSATVQEPITTTTATENLELERYPDPYQIPLKEKVAAYRNHQTNNNNNSILAAPPSSTESPSQQQQQQLTPDHIFVGVGSDEAIDLLFRIFCRPAIDTIVTTPPTYGMYKVCAKINDVGIVSVPLTPAFDVDIAAIIAAITPQTKLVFLCSPGNPTAKAIPLADIQAIVESSAAQQNCIVVVDEAYVDFSTRHPSAVSLVTSFPNVVVLQTLSKAFGLAAIRCGFCIGPPDIIQLMNNVKAPYNVNALTSQMAMRAMDETDGVHKSVQVVLEQREIVAGALRGMVSIVQKVYDSDANFLLVRLHANAQAVYKKLADDYGIVTRYRGTELHCDECIRVTIGTPPQNQAFLDALPLAYAAVRPENNQ